MAVFNIHPPYPWKEEGRNFVKMHGLKNHFIFVDGRTNAYRPDPEKIQVLCDAQTGIGAEELIVFENPSDTNKADFFIRIYNTDGKEVEACINATRCAAWIYFFEKGSQTARIETLAGILECAKAGENRVSVNLGKANFDWQSIPLAREADVSNLGLKSGKLEGGMAVNFGNPHAVFFVEDLEEVDLLRDAMPLYRHPIFPNRANIEVARVRNPEWIEMKVLERPGIITMACGSGACATYAAAKKKGLIGGKRCRITMPAGDVEISEDENANVSLEGPVAFCFSGRLPEPEGRL